MILARGPDTRAFNPPLKVKQGPGHTDQEDVCVVRVARENGSDGECCDHVASLGI